MKASFRATRGLSALALTLALSGCGARAYEGGDSNSNWLKACDPDAECGSGLECLCGICTMECASDQVCGDDEKASCEVPSGCGQPVAVCAPRETLPGASDTTSTRDGDARADGGSTTRDTADTSSDDTLPEFDTQTDATDVDTLRDTTTRLRDNTSPTDTFTGDDTGTTRAVPTGTGTNSLPTDTTGTGTGTVPTGIDSTTTGVPSSPTGTNSTTTVSAPTDTGTTSVDTAALPAEFADAQCSDAACGDGELCFEATGRHCECSPRSELAACVELQFQTLPLPNDLQSCVAHAVSADGSFVVGMCQVVNGPNLAVMWGPDGASVVVGVEEDLTQGLGISDDALLTYWSAGNGGTVAQNGSGQELLFEHSADAFTPDGSVVVGNLNSVQRRFDAYRWSQATGTVILEGLGDYQGASAISADGSTVVGEATKGDVQVPVRWNADGEIDELPLLDGTSSGYANDVSADGSVIVGSSGTGHALRWTADGVELLLEMDELGNSADLVTRDGSRVFGYSLYGAWMWDETNGVQSLEGLLGMGPEWTITHIADVSADGSTIVGSVQLSPDLSPWRWFAFRGRLPAP